MLTLGMMEWDGVSEGEDYYGSAKTSSKGRNNTS